MDDVQSRVDEERTEDSLRKAPMLIFQRGTILTATSLHEDMADTVCANHDEMRDFDER